MEDSFNSLSVIRKRLRRPIFEALLECQRFTSLHKQSRDWIQDLECLQIKDLRRKVSLDLETYNAEADLVLKLLKTVIGRQRLNPLRLSERDYVAVSYTCDPAPDEDPAAGQYLIDSRRKQPPTPSKVRNAVLDRVTRYAKYRNCTLFWIDQECVEQQHPRKKELAIQSMDLVYSLSNHPVALLHVSIDSIEDLNILTDLLTGYFVKVNRKMATLELRCGAGWRAKRALCLLQKITSASWWRRGWTYQEDYRASVKMMLLISHHHALEAQKQYTNIFGHLHGELCIRSARFREQATWLCVAYLTRGCTATERKACESILERAAKYDVLIRYAPEYADGQIHRSMSPYIFADISERSVGRCYDRLAIAANCCGYSVRLHTESLETRKISLSIAMLALYLINGEIIRNDDFDRNGLPGVLFAGSITKYLKTCSLKNFQPSAPKELTFIKGCRFIDVTLRKEGVQTRGFLWKAGKAISTDYHFSIRCEQDSHGGLTGPQRYKLKQLAQALASGWHGKRYSRLAKDLHKYLNEDEEGGKQSLSKQLKDRMACEVVKAIRSGTETLRLACAVDGPLEASSAYRGIFVSDTAEERACSYFFTASRPVKLDGELDKHVSLEVDVRGFTEGGSPRLFVRRWVDGLCFCAGLQPRKAVLPWPESLVM